MELISNIDLPEVISFLMIILTGFFSIYGLLHEYKDKEGILTKHGKIAIYGIVISLVLSVCSFGFKLNADREAKMSELKSIKDELIYQNETINKLDSIIQNVERVNYPLSDLTIKLVFSIDTNSYSVRGLHKRMRETINSLKKKENPYRNFPEIRAIYTSANKIPTRYVLRKNKNSKVFPNFQIPPSMIGLFHRKNNTSIDTFNFRKRAGFNAIFTTPAFGMPKAEIHEEIIEYEVNTGKYMYSIIYTPKSTFSDTNVISHLDLPNSNLGFGMSNHNRNNHLWALEKISFRHSLGYITSFSNFESTKKQFPQVSYFGKPE